MIFACFIAWVGFIALGRFPEIAQKFYPNIVEQVVATGIFRNELPVN